MLCICLGRGVEQTQKKHTLRARAVGFRFSGLGLKRRRRVHGSHSKKVLGGWSNFDKGLYRVLSCENADS